MSNQAQSDSISTEGDGKADAIAAIVLIALVVSAVVFWLKSMTM